MHALVSTSRFLLLVDLESGAVEAVECHRPEYYGVSWFPGSSELVLSHSALNNASLVDLAAYAASEVGFISRGERQSPAFLSQPHQLVCASDGRIVVANTGRNCIHAIDLERPGHFQEAAISNMRWDRLNREGALGDHINSVFEHRGRLYALAHGYKNGSKLAVFTYPGLELVSLDRIPDVTGAHNVCVLDDDLVIGCHSEIGALANLKTGETLWDSGSPVYTRGLAASADHLFIGESQITVRENRGSCAGGIWIVDRNSLRTQDYVPLGPYGAVNEVRLIDVPDLAHHGTPLAGGCEAIGARVAEGTRSARLRASHTAQESAPYWRRFAPVLGSPVADEDGWRTSTNELFIAVLRKSEPGLGCEYRLTAERGAHVSLIAGYRGNGHDTHMDAFLLQREGQTAALSLWRHEGAGWRQEPAMRVGNLPLAGEMRIKISQESASIFFNENPVLTDVALHADLDDSGRLGFRCLGASVRPRR